MEEVDLGKGGGGGNMGGGGGETSLGIYCIREESIFSEKVRGT